MTPEQIRALYTRETAATDAEARATQEAATTDPATARALWQTITALSESDHGFATLLGITLGALLVEIIGERVAADDAFALKTATRLIAMMGHIPSAAPSRPPRGKAKMA